MTDRTKTEFKFWGKVVIAVILQTAAAISYLEWRFSEITTKISDNEKRVMLIESNRFTSADANIEIDKVYTQLKTVQDKQEVNMDKMLTSLHQIEILLASRNFTALETKMEKLELKMLKEIDEIKKAIDNQ